MHLVFSLQVMLIGMLVVFFGLIILIACIELLSAIIGAATKKEKGAPQPQPVPAAAPAAVVIPEPVAKASSDELVAVITAALMAYAGSNKTLVVRSIRRAGAPVWAKAGRAEQLNNRF